MNKLFAFLVALFLISPVFALDVRDKMVPAENQYVLYMPGYDGGPWTDKVVMHTEDRVQAKKIYAGDFEAAVIFRKRKLSVGLEMGTRKITAAYLCDEYGNKSDAEEGKFIALELYVGDKDQYSDMFTHYAAFLDVEPLYILRIKNEELGINIDKYTGVVSPDAAKFKTDKRVFNSLAVPYAWWLPEKKSDDAKVPLIVWFHGAAEGGSSPYLALLGTQAVNLIGPDIQKYFPEGAAVLVPQAQSAWLESTDKDFTGNRMWVPANVSAWFDELFKPLTEVSDALQSKLSDDKPAAKRPKATVSYYTIAVKNLIDDFVAYHPEIDTSRIYLGGASAGGYMVLNMMLRYPDSFAAGFPISEAYPDSRLTDSDIKLLSLQPLWFSWSEDDKTVKPAKNSAATFDRLKLAGAENLHSSVFEKVYDLHGFNDKRGRPVEYDAHSVWIYALNDKCFDGQTSLFEWLNSQKLN